MDTLYIIINSKWIKDLKARPETTKILEECTGSNFYEIIGSNVFLYMSPEARETKAKINYWDHIKIKKLLQSKYNNQQNPQATFQMGEDICK